MPDATEPPIVIGVVIGNTNVKIGAFQDGQIVRDWRLATDVHRMTDEYGLQMLGLLHHAGLHERQVQGVVIGSVVPPLTDTFERLSRRYLRRRALIMSKDVRASVPLRIDNPAEAGADRILNVLAAHRLYGGPAIVVDFGTATVFDALSAQGEYLGGAIAPGVGIAAEALFTQTAQLPRIRLQVPRHAIGTSTVACMQSGIMLGYLGLVEGLTARIKGELGGAARVVATGGLSAIMAGQTTVFDVVEPRLTLHGLHLLWEEHHAA